MTFDIGSVLYFSMYVLIFCVTFLMCFLAKKLGPNWSRKAILVLLWANFILHFAKQLSPSYFLDWPSELKRSTCENLCALMVVISPFCFLSKRKWLEDYIMLFGCISGIAALIYPSPVMGKDLFTYAGCFEFIRYYVCHGIIIIVGFMMYFGKQHKLSYKCCFRLWLMFLAAQVIVFGNEWFCFKIGLSDWHYNEFASRDYGNGTLAFGPYSSLDPYLSWAYCLIPSAFKYYSTWGELMFKPVVWMLVPSLILIPFFFGCSLFFAYDEFKKDFYFFRYRIKLKNRKRKLNK